MTSSRSSRSRCSSTTRPAVRLLSDASSIDLYGLDGNEQRSNLPGISQLVLEPAGTPRHRPQPGADPGQAAGGSAWCSAGSGGRLVGDRDQGGRLTARAGRTGWRRTASSSRTVPGSGSGCCPRRATQQEQGRRAHDRRARVPGHVAAPARRPAASPRPRRVRAGRRARLPTTTRSGSAWTCGSPARPTASRSKTQLSMIRQIGEALQYAHNNRVVHRGLVAARRLGAKRPGHRARRQGPGRRLAGLRHGRRAPPAPTSRRRGHRSFGAPPRGRRHRLRRRASPRRKGRGRRTPTASASTCSASAP